MKLKENLDKIGLVLLALIFIFMGYQNRQNDQVDNNQLTESLGESSGEVLNLKDDELIKETDLESNLEDFPQTDYVYIHVSGCVINPGLYQLESNLRVNHAIDAAGGLCQEADINRINLSKKIYDEMKIHIYKVGEEGIDLDENQDKISVNSGIPSKININTADEQALISIPGIGEVKAKEIIAYRQQQKFESLEDIMNISGIGEKTFEKLKNYITINWKYIKILI